MRRLRLVMGFALYWFMAEPGAPYLCPIAADLAGLASSASWLSAGSWTSLLLSIGFFIALLASVNILHNRAYLPFFRSVSVIESLGLLPPNSVRRAL
jgi:hypothetical protein